MKEEKEKIMGYSVRLGKKVELVNVKEVLMRNGMLAVKGKCKENEDNIFKIVRKATPEDIKRLGGIPGKKKK